jgi:hypothetical protein
MYFLKRKKNKIGFQYVQFIEKLALAYPQYNILEYGHMHDIIDLTYFMFHFFWILLS